MTIICNLCLATNDPNHVSQCSFLTSEQIESLQNKQVGAYVASDTVLIPRRDSTKYPDVYQVANKTVPGLYGLTFLKYKYICEICFVYMIAVGHAVKVDESDNNDNEWSNDLFGDFSIDI